MQTDDTITQAAAQADQSLVRFLKAILPSEGVYCWTSIVAGKAKNHHCNTIEEMAEQIRQSNGAGVDTYHACGTFISAQNRRAANAGWFQCFFADVDVGVGKPYATIEDAIKAVDGFCGRLGLPIPGILRSGGGIHIYWVLDKTLTKEDWLPVAERLKSLCKQLEFAADPSRTADAASILRPHGTKNYKIPGLPRNVEVDDWDFFAPINADAFIAALFAPVNAVPSGANASLSAGLHVNKTFDPTMDVEEHGGEHGGRNNACTAYAGTLFRKGLAEDDVLKLCLEWNHLRCKPPMEVGEVSGIVASIAKAEAEKKTADLTPEQEKEARRLAALSPIQYDQQRLEIAKQLGIRAPTLDEAVDRFRPKRDDDGAKKSGSALMLYIPELWPEPVDGAALLDEMVTEILRYIILPDGATEGLALWTVHTHAFEVFSVTPRLTITSPEKRCGKTRVLEVLNELTPKPLLFANVTPAAIFRTVEAMRPTLLIDEADTFATDKNELRGIVNSGYMKNGKVIRTVGDDHEPRAFSTWCPTAFAAIGKLPDTIEDRSVIISMRRRKPGEKLQRFRAGKMEGLNILARKAARWAKDNMEKLGDANPDMPEGLHDRAADIWRPLIAIADAVGGEWPERARRTALLLSGAGVQEDQSVKVLLLGDIRDIFKAQGVEKMPTSDLLLGGLHRMQDRQWNDWDHGKEMSPAQFATLLKPFGIKPKDIRVKDVMSKDGKEKVVKGYELAQFAETFSRYLPSVTCDLSATNAT